jgi:membrane protein DedA with SNARE-associated domain
MDIPAAMLQHAPLAALFALLVLGGIGLPFPEDGTLILTGVLIANGTIHAPLALPVVYAGVLIADLLLYHMGRKFGRQIVTHRRFRRLLPEARLASLEDRFRRSGSLFVLVGRHAIGLRAQIFLVAGIVKMPVATFLAADALSALGTLAVMIGIGYAGGNSLDALRKDLTRIEHAAVAAGAAALFIALIVRYFRARGAK